MADPASLAVQAVDAIHGVYGSHAGRRAVHSKGTLLKGTFTPTPEAARSRARRSSPPRRPWSARVSNGGGNPEAPDFDQDGRGLAVKFSLPDGSTTDMVTTSLPAFIARTPEDFVEFDARAQARPRDRLPRRRGRRRLHREASRGDDGDPAHGHLEAAGELRDGAVREPAHVPLGREEGRAGAGSPRTASVRWSPRRRAERGADYLQEEILERAAAGGAAWRLVVVLGTDEDSTSDPTEVWPEDRETVDAGRLVLTGPETERETGDDVLVFDPTRVCEGIELSDDPIVTLPPRRLRGVGGAAQRRSGRLVTE